MQRRICMAQELSEERKSEIALADQLRAEVMRGLQCGEPVERLLLKAVQSMALKDNDTVSYPEAKKTLIAIYGDALGQPVPLQIELEETEQRLERLRKAYEEGEGVEPYDVQERVKNAIRAHEARIALLKDKIAGKG
jgi:phage baseplate assembly protein W